jgi:eukaryotic-like serine/threonine-protein kinase
MTRWIADGTLAHLRDVADWPDLGERYEVKGRLGRGGMGAVYSAHDRVLDRDVAVKVLDPTSASEETAARLLNEARILARLEHPGIVPIHDAGTIADGRVFYVMKLVRGARLRDAIETDASAARRIELVLRICDAVAFAHAHGVVHGDLKPDNVMLGPFGEVLVIDWGVAAILGRPETSGVVAGTPGYMAPEQADGARRVDARADVYALGTILDALMARPLPRPLGAIAARARAERPDDRYKTVEALALDIDRWRNGERVSAHRENALERTGRFYRRYRLAILLVAAYMIMRMILILWARV